MRWTPEYASGLFRACVQARWRSLAFPVGYEGFRINFALVIGHGQTFGDVLTLRPQQPRRQENDKLGVLEEGKAWLLLERFFLGDVVQEKRSTRDFVTSLHQFGPSISHDPWFMCGWRSLAVRLWSFPSSACQSLCRSSRVDQHS